MRRTRSSGSGAAEQPEGQAEMPDYVPLIGMQDLLRQMIVGEVRAGNLTKSGRQQIRLARDVSPPRASLLVVLHS